jgi:glycosyltransferase involved in cell wall biosynthesis
MLLVLTSLFGATGGIPSFNRLLVRAATDWVSERAGRLRVVVLCDPLNTPSPRALPEYLPCGGDRLLCTALTMRAAETPLLFGHVNLAPLGLFGRLRGRPYGVIAHGTEVWSPQPWHRRLALHGARAVAGVSADTVARLERVQGVATGRCVRVINALGSSVEELPPLVEREPGGPLRLLSVTRLHPGEPKGIDLVLRALARLPAKSFEYTVVGEGAAGRALRALADELGLGERVRFAGWLPDAERNRALAGCDVFVLPSSGEGFGIVYLEAMAYGKPCLAARVGGAPEVVLDGETGLLVEPTVESVRAALARLADPGLRARLGVAGRARVAAHFTYEAFRRHAGAFFDRLGEPSDRRSGG